MRFLVDAQLPPELAIWLTAQGHHADHVEDIGLLTASDNAVWMAALSIEAVVVTKDHDFVEWVTARDPAPRIVWIRIGNARNAELIARFEAVWDKVVENLESGALVVQAGRS